MDDQVWEVVMGQHSGFVVSRPMKTGLGVMMVALLAGCGGGGGGSASAPLPAPVLNTATSSPELEISVDAPVAAAGAASSSAIGYAHYSPATNIFLPSGSGGNPDGLQTMVSATGQVSVTVPPGQIPGIYRLGINAVNGSSAGTGNLFEVLVYPAGQASSSAGVTVPLTAPTEVSFPDPNHTTGSTSPVTATVIIPPRLNVSYFPSLTTSPFIASNFTWIRKNLSALSSIGVTVNTVTVDSQNNLNVSMTITPSTYQSESDPGNASNTTGFLMEMTVPVFDNGQNPGPYTEVFYVKPSVPI